MGANWDLTVYWDRWLILLPKIKQLGFSWWKLKQVTQWGLVRGEAPPPFSEILSVFLQLMNSRKEQANIFLLCMYKHDLGYVSSCGVLWRTDMQVIVWYGYHCKCLWSETVEIETACASLQSPLSHWKALDHVVRLNHSSPLPAYFPDHSHSQIWFIIWPFLRI